ncbi:uncharacterized protein LOC124255849 [Haliotis rubra]|uniref:uncharacterized protein LOC124255849 n=1 Tax=Haliotis rubra TaxID=36100 RepID=UPI001EE58E8A|nr:uncharacterized protein LOC124255849 [Haliotis rubra]
MDTHELGNSPILPDPELPPDFVWSAQTQLSHQYRPQSVGFSPRLICDQPDTFSDNCTWPSVSQPESIYTPAVGRRWASREQPDIHSTEAQWPFSDDESTIHISSQNGPGSSTSNAFHDDYPSPFLSSRYHDLYEQARRDLDHLPADSESGSCSSHGQPLPALTTAYRDLYERARSELDNDPPSDQSDSSNGQQPSSSSQNDSRINLEHDSRQEHQLYAPGDFPEEEDSSGSDSSPEQAPYCDSGYDDSFSGDHRPEFIDQGVILHPHQPGAMPQMYRCDVEQVLLLEVIPVVPQIQAVEANQNAWHVPVIQIHPNDQRNASLQTAQVDLTLNRTAFDCCWTQNAVDHSLNSSSTSRMIHEDSTVSNGHFTWNSNLRSSKDTVPATQEHNTSPIIISSDSSPDNSVLTSLHNGVYSQVNNLSPSGDCSTASSAPYVSTSTSSDSNSVAFFPSPHKACSITLSSQRCHFADDMTEMVLSTKVNSGIDGKRAHTEIGADDEATWDGFPDTGRDDRMLRRMNRVKKSEGQK